jgi:glycosyltransferase involved in cell wall biosynthesis
LKSKTLIAIPVYNEIRNLDSFLTNLTVFDYDLLAVDDGSDDGSAETLKKYGIQVIHHKQNMGLGECYKTIRDFANKYNYQYVVSLDSDGQHDPVFIPEIIQQLEKADFVIGNRFASRLNIPKEKISSNFFASLLVESITGVFISDVSCGFRGYHIESLNNVNIEKSSFDFIFQKIFESLLEGESIKSVKMPANYTAQVMDTKSTEILSLLKQANKYTSNKRLIEIIEKVKGGIDFHFELMGITFTFKKTTSHSYIISVEQIIAEDYYKSNINAQWN